MKLVDTLDEQAVLEELIERTKVSVPDECRQLHYLLFTPFRYGAPYPTGSRFRRAGYTPGVFYASASAGTAIAEMVFHRLLFYADSPDTPWPQDAGEYTAFSATFATRAALDLTMPPLAADRERWTDVSDYAASQSLADDARTAVIAVLRYESVRDPGPGRGINIALLTCTAFGSRRPRGRQTWRIHFSASGVRAICDSPRQQAGFGRDAFAADRRIASLRWERHARRHD